MCRPATNKRVAKLKGCRSTPHCHILGIQTTNRSQVTTFTWRESTLGNDGILVRLWKNCAFSTIPHFHGQSLGPESSKPKLRSIWGHPKRTNSSRSFHDRYPSCTGTIGALILTERFVVFVLTYTLRIAKRIANVHIKTVMLEYLYSAK